MISAPPSGRELLRDLYEAAVLGASPGPLTSHALSEFEARPDQRLWLYAFGKAAHAMAGAAVTTLQGTRHQITGGIVVSQTAATAPCATVAALAGDHPLPGRHSFTAAERIGATTTGMRSNDVAFVLVSGGTSSLIAAPLRGMSEADLGQLFELLLGSGLDVREMNAVRKRFVRWGAGRLALALAPARTHVLVVSDVPGDDPADVGSGPCAPDQASVREVIDIMKRTGIHDRVSQSMRDHLQGVARGLVPETPKRTHPAFAHVSTHVVGTNAQALDAVRARAEELALPVEVVATPLAGDAARRGREIGETLLARAAAGWRGVVVWGGETTVTLATSRLTPPFAGRRVDAVHEPLAPGMPPTGGRCQELALAATRTLADAGEPAQRVHLLAAGTDGRDGPTDAAGAFADACSWAAMQRSGHDPALALSRHESYAALDAAGALLRRGPTGTNVMDVVIGLVE